MCAVVLRLGFALLRQMSVKTESNFKLNDLISSRSCRQCSNLSKSDSEILSLKPCYMTLSNTLSMEECIALYKDMIVVENFLSETEEKTLYDEVEPYMTKLHYEYDHWDNAIHGFRETERLHWSQPGAAVLNRVRKTAFPEGKPQLKHVHVLDLSAEGYIKPHIDSVKFCGDTIAGLSLLSDCVMRLIHDEEKSKIVDVLLKRRSLYIMRDTARYNYTHEILSNDVSLFNCLTVPKGRRISIICRSEVMK